MDDKLIHPDYIFEVSWEVCNKVGGIHTVLSTRALTMVNEWEDKVIFIGPDVWKGTGEHPEFAEDKDLFPSWQAYAASRGLHIRIGRWKITGNPVAILVDFTTFFATKNELFGNLWVRYKVDSLTGQWDYIEPALFGYAAGKVIETFYHHHLIFSDKIIAHFHEWMTGVGVLYLEEHVSQIGTVFTTHATVVGRCLAGNDLPLYSKFESYNADQEARRFNVIAKHSLERSTAAFADCFTTVSEITAKECERFLGKKPDVITPNGFDDFIVPDPFFFVEKRALARKRLLGVARALSKQELPEDSLLVIKSGRYEFRNKGIDLFIDALGALNCSVNLKKQVVAFIFVPGSHTGPVKGLLKFLNDNTDAKGEGNGVLTHYLQGSESDPILNRLHKNNLDNRAENKVKVVFAPIYLSGDDGVFDMSYYELLTGFDISAFPSYYEPWGYTPLESLAFRIPTITTNLTGFGMVIHPGTVNIDQGIAVIDRNDTNSLEVVKNIASIILEYSEKDAGHIKAARDAAYQLSKSALWKNLIGHYKKAYSVALENAGGRGQRFRHQAKVESLEPSSTGVFSETDTPTWRKIFVESQLPEVLKPLGLLSKNLWWTWNMEAAQLFQMIDKESWEQSRHSPILFLNELSLAQTRKLEKNQNFIDRMSEVYRKFENYTERKADQSPQVAYFCMEFGLDSNLKIYSGGLGVLAGDYMKQASDERKNVIGVGLLYRQGYFNQNISMHGEQADEYNRHKFTNLPLLPVYDNENNWLMVSLGLPGRTLYAKVWKVEVGRVPLYLLDTDITENRDEDRAITAQLYGGDWENRLKQELLLGIAGVRMLRLLGYEPDVYHFNEGHVAFAGIERLRMLVQDENLSFDEALEIVRASTLFTTHTSVPAGHDMFSEELLRVYLSQHSNLFNISWKRLVAMGRLNENDSTEKFSMSYFAARLSQEINGVSQLHEKVSRRIFKPLWNGYAAAELHIGHITNGVHYPTWASASWQKLNEETFGEGFTDNVSEVSYWQKMRNVPNKSIWDIHTKLKKELIEEVTRRVSNDNSIPWQNRKNILQQLNSLDEKSLVIGFARRFAAYKRSLLLFNDQERLASILKNADCPILFLFAGKAHQQDFEGKEMIKRLLEISRRPEFEGRVIFLSNYDIDLARYLTQGVDVWLNTPDSEMEASGTSGMKALMNGVLNFSMADGWWAEAFREDSGWTFGTMKNCSTHEIRNELDAENLYKTLENEIIPVFVDRDKDGVPLNWVVKIKNAAVSLAPHFTMKRTLHEYYSKYYEKLCNRNQLLRNNQFAKAKELAGWKFNISKNWDGVQVISTQVFDSANKAFPLGGELRPEVVLDLNKLPANDIGVEIIFITGRKAEENFGEIVFKKELLLIGQSGNLATFGCQIPITQYGVYEYGFRVYPKNPLLSHRQDFPLYKWF